MQTRKTRKACKVRGSFHFVKEPAGIAQTVDTGSHTVKTLSTLSCKFLCTLPELKFAMHSGNCEKQSDSRQAVKIAHGATIPKLATMVATS